jgi:hypothetical protein
MIIPTCSAFFFSVSQLNVNIDSLVSRVSVVYPIQADTTPSKMCLKTCAFSLPARMLLRAIITHGSDCSTTIQVHGLFLSPSPSHFSRAGTERVENGLHIIPHLTASRRAITTTGSMVY